MRIPFPDSFPVQRAVVFSTGLLVLQVVEGTSFLFAIGCFFYIVLAALAFNMGGGMSRVAGAYVFCNAMLVVIIGVCYKAFLGEAADSNLRDPMTTISVYVGMMTAMIAAIAVSNRLSRSTGLLENMLKRDQMYRSMIGCIVFGVFGPLLLIGIFGASSKIVTGFMQVNFLLPIAITIGTIDQIRRSGGARSVNFPVLLASSYYFVFFGILSCSKQGLLTPLICWFIPVCALRFRLSIAQGLIGAACFAFLFYYLVPYTQIARRAIPETTFSQRISICFDYLTHLERTREEYSDALGEPSQDTIHYYDTQQGFFDRLQFIAADDALIAVTHQGNVFGLLPLYSSVLNIIPHVIWPNKPMYNFGNRYAHEVGGLVADDDSSTGISWSPASDAFHMASWFGTLIVSPLVWIIGFVAINSLCGDLRATPWGLFTLTYISHVAPEGGLGGVISLATLGAVTITFCAFFATYLAPLVGAGFPGPEQKKKKTPDFARPALQPATSLLD